MSGVVENAVVIGGGPAGYTAALYLARADLAPLVVEGVTWGGLLQETTTVENYPGFPKGVFGPDLMADFRDQAERFGARFVTDDAANITLGADAGDVHVTEVGATSIRSRTVVLAMGARHRKLGVAGEGELGGQGVSYCATCDAAFHRGKDTAVIGGGDSAMEEALFLSRFAETVTIVHRRDTFRASPVMLDRARATANIRWMAPYTVEEFVAGPSGSLDALRLVHAQDGVSSELRVQGAFLAIGHVPQSALVASRLPVDANGYVQVIGRTSRTAIPGVFAAGDLIDPVYRQAITAAASGCQAALDAQTYLGDL